MPFEEHHYKNIDEKSSPAGFFVVCEHELSGELRSLKILRPGLKDVGNFIAWYTASLKIAGEAASKLPTPGLIAPMQAPDGKWYSIRNDKFVIERRYFGSEHYEAYNINQFVDKFGHSSDGWGLDEPVVIAIMLEVAKTLGIMHGTRFQLTNIAQNGFPHLNLKPENVLIGYEPSKGGWTVRLTDFLISSASPMFEDVGVKAPLNYSLPSLLNDTYYFKLHADIFSCGLLLHKLCEGRDLVPGNISRIETTRFLREELPDLVQQLTLTRAKDLRKMIQRCLLPGEEQRYSSIAQLQTDLGKAFKQRETSAVIKKCVDSRLTKPSPTPPPPHPPKPPSKWKKIALVLGILAIAAGVWWDPYCLIYRNDCHNWTQLLDESQSALDNSKSCLGFTPEQSYDSELDDLRKKLTKRVLSSSDEKRLLILHSELNTLERYCDTLVHFDSKRSGIPSSNVNCRDEFDAVYLSAEEALRKADTLGVSNRIDSLVEFSKCGERPNECDPEALRADLEAKKTGIRNECIARADRLIQAAVNACRDGFTIDVENYRTRLADLVTSAPCMLSACEAQLLRMRSKVTNSLAADCRSQLNNLILKARTACQQNDMVRFRSSRQAFDDYLSSDICKPCAQNADAVHQAEQAIAGFTQSYDDMGIAYEECADFSEAKKSLKRAKDFLESDSCSQAAWNANTCISQLEEVQACANLKILLRRKSNDVKNCEEINTYATKVDEARQLIAQCLCTKAREVLMSIPLCETSCDECEQAVLGGSIESWRICLQMSDDCPLANRALAGKFALIAASNDELAWSIFSREKFADAYRLIDSEHFIESPPQSSVDNARILITMTCLFGWDKDNIVPNEAVKYYDLLVGLGYIGRSQQNYCKALFSGVQALYEKFRLHPSRGNGYELRRAIERFKDDCTENAGMLEKVEDIRRGIRNNPSQ